MRQSDLRGTKRTWIWNWEGSPEVDLMVFWLLKIGEK